MDAKAAAFPPLQALEQSREGRGDGNEDDDPRIVLIAVRVDVDPVDALRAAEEPDVVELAGYREQDEIRGKRRSGPTKSTQANRTE